MKSPRQTPNRDDRYMGLAFIHSSFSKDPSTQVGAVIVNNDNEITGTGYNGPPKKIDDRQIDWDRPYKYPFVVHAEKNAIAHSWGSTKGSTLYVTANPCKHCMLEIVNAEIARVVYFDMAKIAHTSSMLSNINDMNETKQIAHLGGVKLEIFKGDLNWLPDWISHMKDLGAFENVVAN